MDQTDRVGVSLITATRLPRSITLERTYPIISTITGLYSWVFSTFLLYIRIKIKDTAIHIIPAINAQRSEFASPEYFSARFFPMMAPPASAAMGTPQRMIDAFRYTCGATTTFTF